MKRFAWLLLLVIIGSVGCGKVELNKAAIPIAFGVDTIDKQLLVSIQIAQSISPENNGANMPQNPVISARGNSVAEASRNLSQFFSLIPLWSQVQVSLLSDTKAQQGIDDLLDFLIRNRFQRKTNTFVITKNCTPEQILNINPYLEPYTGMAIRNLLKNQEKQLGIYTHTDLREFLQKLAAPGVEATAPLITIYNNGRDKQLLLDGMAVFKRNKMIGSLNEIESRGYSLMNPRSNTTGLFLIPSPIDSTNQVTLEISYSKAKVKPLIDGSNLKMAIEISLDGNFYEQGGEENLFTRDAFQKIERSAERELKRQMTLTIEKAQLLNSDIFGWGNLVYRQNPRLWQKVGDNWEQIFPTIPYEINVDFQLRRSYLTDKSFVLR